MAKDAVKTAVELAARCGTKSYTPVTSYVRLGSSNGSLQLDATDIDTHVCITVANAGVNLPMPMCVDGAAIKKVSAAVRGAVARDSALQCGAVRIQSAMDTHDWPVTPSLDTAAVYHGSYDSGAFDVALEYAMRVMCQDSTRYSLHGVLLDHGAFVATDGHRLHRATFAPDDNNVTAFMSASCATRLSHCIKALSPTMIDVNVGRTHIEFVLQGGIARAVIVSRLPDAQFPPYEKVIPTGVIEISVAAPIVDDLCARVATVVKLTTAKSTNGIVLQFNADKVCIESVDANYNDHEEDSSGLKFCVNPRYLLDAMRGVEGQTLLVRGDNQPLQLVSVTTMALVMPMRL